MVADSLTANGGLGEADVANERPVEDRFVLVMWDHYLVALYGAQVLGDGVDGAKERILMVLDGCVLDNQSAVMCLLWEYNGEFA